MKYLVANWKMKMDLPNVDKWFDYFEKRNYLPRQVTPIVAPSFVHIPYAFLLKEKISGFYLAAQDVSSEGFGSHTGDVGAFQLKEFCDYCIIGHSERGEDISVVGEKRDVLLKAGLTPIICFVSFDDGRSLYKEGVVMAWEDPDNISKGKVYNEKPIQDVINGLNEIRTFLSKEAVLLYGGSVNKENIDKLSSIKDLDGVLVGQSSLDAEQFLELMKAYEVS